MRALLIQLADVSLDFQTVKDECFVENETDTYSVDRAKVVAAEAKAHPDWFSYLYTQAAEYAKLKTVCASNAIAKTQPAGVATIEIAIEALKLSLIHI